MSDETWLSKAAVLWVIHEAPGVPAHLLSTLIIFAAHSGPDGRGAYPSIPTMARLTRKGERRVKRDIAELVNLGLLTAGNQAIVEKIRADRRPKVYDLPMPRGVPEDTPSSHGVSNRAERGVKSCTNGVVERTPKEVLNTSGIPRKRASANGARSRGARQCSRTATGRLSNACRAGQSSQCAFGWCECTCHSMAAAS